MKPGSSQDRRDQRLPLARLSAYLYALVFRSRSIFALIQPFATLFLIDTHAKENSPQLVDNIHSRSFLIETLSPPAIV
jgi:hypothetical protein